MTAHTKPTILYILTRGDSLGGAQIHVRDLTGVKNTFFNPVVAVGSTGVLTDMLEKQGTSFYHLPALTRAIGLVQEVKAFVAITKLIWRLKPDLVSLHSSKSGVLGRLACFVTWTPCIFTAHGWSFTSGVPLWQRFLYRVIEFLTLWPAKKIICVSNYDKKLVDSLRVYKKKTRVIHNGVHDNGAKNTYTSLETYSACMVGRFAAQKDHLTLVRALKLVPDVRLIFIGDGPDEKSIKEYVQDAELYSRTEFLGVRTDVPTLLQTYDVYALISHWEGFPRSILEAMAAGLPIIASDVGGTRETIQNGVEGFIIPEGSVPALAEKLTFFSKHPEEREKMGRAARKRYEKFFTFERLRDETFSLYKELLHR